MNLIRRWLFNSKFVQRQIAELVVARFAYQIVLKECECRGDFARAKEIGIRRLPQIESSLRFLYSIEPRQE